MATLEDVKLDAPVEFSPYVNASGHSRPLNTAYFVLGSSLVKAFFDELQEKGKLEIIEDTLQGLSQRADGTLLKTAFPSLTEFKSAVQDMTSTPKKLLDLLLEWESNGANEIDIAFEEL